MQGTDRSRRGARVASAVPAGRRSFGVGPAARRWLVVAGLLSGAWFAGAACAAADDTAVPDLPGSAATGESAVQDGQERGGPAQNAAPAAAAGNSDASADSGSGPSAGAGGSTGSAGPADSAGSTSAGDRTGGTRADTPKGGVGTAVDDGVDALATEAVGPRKGADASAAASPGASSEAGRQRSAADRISGTVGAVGDVGRTVPDSVTRGAPSAAAAVSGAAAGEAADSLPGFGPAGLQPGFDGASVLPDLGAGDEADAVPGSDRGQDSGESAARETGAAPSAGSGSYGFPVAAPAAGDAGSAPYSGPAEATGGEDSAPHDSRADRPEAAAAVGSGANTAQSGGVCAGYLPAAATAAPAAGLLQCARQALVGVPQDLGEKPTFSPD